MNLSAMLADFNRRMNYAATPDATVTARATAFLNETQQEIVAEPGMSALLFDSFTFASVASTPTVPLPPSIARIRQVYDTSNQIVLTPLDLASYRQQYPSPTAVTGIPDAWVDLGYTGVAIQPSNASELFVKSDAAADGATKTAVIEGYTTGGYYRSAQTALNGVTAVSFGATITSWIEITKFYLVLTAGGTTSAAGNVTLQEDSGVGTELARIPISQSYARYRTIALAPCPSSAVTYTVDTQRDLTDLVNPADEPSLPVRFHRMLVAGAMAKEWEKQDDARALTKRQEFATDLRKLKFFLYSQSAGTPNLRGVAGSARVSRLGAWFGADRW